MISAASSSSSAFTTSGLSLPITLNAGQSVSFNVAFSPTSGGSASGNLAITSNASNPALNVPLSGTGTTPGQLTASPTNLGFGSVQVGNSGYAVGNSHQLGWNQRHDFCGRLLELRVHGQRLELVDHVERRSECEFQCRILAHVGRQCQRQSGHHIQCI